MDDAPHDAANPDLEARLDAAWTALDEDRTDEVLAATSALAAEPGAATYAGELGLLEVQARLRNGDRAGATAALATAADRGALPNDTNLLLARAELALALWSIDEARELYARLAAAAHPDDAAPHHMDARVRGAHVDGDSGLTERGHCRPQVPVRLQIEVLGL